MFYIEISVHEAIKNNGKPESILFQRRGILDAKIDIVGIPDEGVNYTVEVRFSDKKGCSPSLVKAIEQTEIPEVTGIDAERLVNIIFKGDTFNPYLRNE